MREDISNRFLEFAARIIELGRLLNKTFEGRHVYGQLFRSGTSSGANYEESHSAESSNDFIHKREICLKELRESFFRLKLIERPKLVPPENETIVFLLQKNQELINIIAKSLITTKRKISSKSK